MDYNAYTMFPVASLNMATGCKPVFTLAYDVCFLQPTTVVGDVVATMYSTAASPAVARATAVTAYNGMAVRADGLFV